MAVKTEYQEPKRNANRPSRKARKRYVDHDTQWYSDPKIKVLIQEAGLEAWTVLQLIADLTWNEASCTIAIDKVTLRGAALTLPGLTPEKLTEVITKATELGLIEQRKDRISVPYRRRQADEYEAFCDQKREFAVRGGQARAKQVASQVASSQLADGLRAIIPYTTISDPIFPKGGSGGEPPTDDWPDDLKDLQPKFIPLSETITHDNRYMLSGWRPLKKYPHVWLTPAQFRDSLEQIAAAGIEDPYPIFRAAEAWYSKPTGENRMKPAFTAVTGWILQEHLTTMKKGTDAARSKQYLNEARTGAPEADNRQRAHQQIAAKNDARLKEILAIATGGK